MILYIIGSVKVALNLFNLAPELHKIIIGNIYPKAQGRRSRPCAFGMGGMGTLPFSDYRRSAAASATGARAVPLDMLHATPFSSGG
jgi:hypothetical protein